MVGDEAHAGELCRGAGLGTRVKDVVSLSWHVLEAGDQRQSLVRLWGGLAAGLASDKSGTVGGIVSLHAAHMCCSDRHCNLSQSSTLASGPQLVGNTLEG